MMADDRLGANAYAADWQAVLLDALLQQTHENRSIASYVSMYSFDAGVQAILPDAVLLATATTQPDSSASAHKHHCYRRNRRAQHVLMLQVQAVFRKTLRPIGSCLCERELIRRAHKHLGIRYCLHAEPLVFRPDQ